MFASAVATRTTSATSVGRSRPTMTMESTLCRSCSRLRSRPRTTSSRGSVSVGGILDSYRSAQQAAPPSPPPTDEDFDDEGGNACPVGCVAEITKKSELERALAAAEARASAGSSSSSSSSSSSPALSPGIVVVDFYKTACGACKYIAPGFVKLCKSASSSSGNNNKSSSGENSSSEEEGGGGVPDIVFLKHNVERDGDGSSDDESGSDGGAGGDGGGRTALAVSLKIRSVPLFHVYRGRELVASFATRDRKRVADAINEAVGREVL